MTLHRVLADPASLGTWALVPGRSSIKFGSKTLWGLVPVNGRFTDVNGDGTVAADGAVTGHITIGAASVKTGIKKRDEHLRSADFFDTENFPEITVEVSGVASNGDLNATLRVRGTTLPIPLTATVTPLGDGTVQVTARTTVDRTKWGISGNTMGMIPSTTTLIAEAVFIKA